MIKFENTDVYNFMNAIRGMRNPLNSWDKSDSKRCNNCDGWVSAPRACMNWEKCSDACIKLGENDMKLMRNLIKAGSDHRKFLRQIFVSVDITAPLYWWKEFDTYKVGTVANSCSTMHKIHDKEFTFDDFSVEYLNGLDGIELLIEPTENITETVYPYGFFNMKLALLNKYRELYLETKNKKYWYALIQELPSSYNQKRTVTLNYEVIRNMYHSRKNHKLNEWSKGFTNWVVMLPYGEELIIN